MIEKIDWDSSFFGYNVGKTTITTIDDINTLLKNLHNQYKLVYVFSKFIIENSNFKLVDKKVTFKKKITNSNNTDLNNTIELYKKDNFNKGNKQIETLAYLSGKYSRFKTDINFKNNEFKKLYKIWITDHIKKNKKIIIKKHNNIISGFILYSISEETIYIELISVSEQFQGKGIGSELIEEIEKIGVNSGSKYIEVVTQGENIPAVNLHKKNNFELINSVLIYHYWTI